MPPGTKVLNDWALGGYLMWRYPQLDLVMHGYGDTFTTAELTRNNDLLLTAAGLAAGPARTSAPGSRCSGPGRCWPRGCTPRRAGGSSSSSDDLELLEAPAGWPSGG